MAFLLDGNEFAGGGGFGNPASSLSRRAIAAGFTEADLPALAVAANATDEEDVLDPDSSFRKAWDAALLRCAGNRPERVAGLSAGEKAAVALAVAGCRDEPDLLSIVTAGIGRIVKDGRGRLREEDDIKRIVMDLRANLAELREAAADDTAAFAAGLELLRGLGGHGAPAGYLKYLLDAVRRAHIDAAREAYLRRAVPGNSAAAAALRGLFATRLAGSPSIAPRETIGRLFAGSTANMLNLSIVRGVKRLATARNAHEFALTQFAVDRHRHMDVRLPDGTLLSRDPATAADELARFVTGRPDAAYAQLAGAERTKVQVVMSVLTQESSSTVVEGPATALDPEGRRTAFYYGRLLAASRLGTVSPKVTGARPVVLRSCRPFVVRPPHGGPFPG